MEKKYNIVLGLMIFFFLIIVGVAIAWGLGYIGLKDSEIEKNNTDVDSSTKQDIVLDNNIGKEDNTNKQENNKNETVLTLSEIQELNKEYTCNYVSAGAAGDAVDRARIIMGYKSYGEIDPHFTNETIEELYIVTDIDYSSFTERLSYLSQSLVDNLYSFGSAELFKEHNGKLAIHQGGWTGVGVDFVSQQLISNKDNEYVWNVTFNCKGPDEIIQIRNYKVTGELKNGKYILASVEEL